ncbi:MAG: polymer-forming cytoskeletal protein [Alcaligenaceae bacterium]
MFGKKNPPKIVRSIDESFETIISQSTEIHGQIIATQSLRIDGTVTGDIRVSQAGNACVAIGLTGVVQGDIHAQRLIVGGRISGNVFVTEAVELHESADIQGDITYGQISIEPGAKINGRMITQANAQQGQLTTEGQPTLVQPASNQALPAPASD